MEIFSSHHLICLALSFASIAVVLLIGRRLESAGAAKPLRYAIGISCLLAYPVTLLAYQLAGYHMPIEIKIPYHLCDLSVILAGFAMIYKQATLRELVYYWGLAGATQAMLTPDINESFTHPVALAFYFSHLGVVCAALYLPICIGWRPRAGSVRRAVAWLAVYAIVAGALNFLLGANFGFLAAKPGESSLMDVMGPWPWYILSLGAIASLLFYLLSLPFRQTKQK